MVKIDSRPQTITWVTGAPRSGTHLITALASTGEQVNPFVPEFHAMNSAILSWLSTERAFGTQKYFFHSADTMKNIYLDHIRSLVDSAWKSLGSPRHLLLKHCTVTPFIPKLLSALPEWRYVVVIRDPRDVISSEVRGWKRENASEAIPDGLIDQLAKQYLQYYRPLIEVGCLSDSRVCGVSYEDIVNGHHEDLEEFLGYKIFPDNVWKSELFEIGKEYKNTRAHSESWGKSVISTRIGSHIEHLSSDQSSSIIAKTGLISSFFREQLRAENDRRHRLATKSELDTVAGPGD